MEKKINLMKKICTDHFLDNILQTEIAKKYKISPATVSRLISEAIEKGYVKYYLDFPGNLNEELSEQIKLIFNLKHVEVFKNDTDIFRSIAMSLSDYLEKKLNDNEIIGLSWGETMFKVSNEIQNINKKDLTLVQLHGGVSNNKIDTKGTDIIRNFAEEWKADWFTLPAPSIVDDEFTADIIKKDSTVKIVFDLIKQTKTAIYSIGTMDENALGIRAGYFSKDEFKKLEQKGYIGDICSRYFNKEGKYISEALYNRVLGMDLETLKNKDNKICIVTDLYKVDTLLAAIKGELTNILYVDEATAKEMISIKNGE